jgi:hypothetical protein
MIQLLAQGEAASIWRAHGIRELRPRPRLELTGIEPQIVEALVERAPRRQLIGELPGEPKTLRPNFEVAVRATNGIPRENRSEDDRGLAGT